MKFKIITVTLLVMFAFVLPVFAQVPNYSAFVQSIFDEGRNNLESHAGSGCFTEQVAYRLYQTDSSFGHLRKNPGQNQWNGHAVDAILHLPTGRSIDIISGSGEQGARPSWQVDSPRYSANDFIIPIAGCTNASPGEPPPQPPPPPPPAPPPLGPPPGNSNGQSQPGTTDFTQIFGPSPNPVSEGATTPSLPELPPVRDFGELIESIFSWALALVGAAVFVNFLWAGFLWFTATGRTGPISEAKEKMTNALIGAIILLASYLILKTINPDLIQQTLTLPGL